MPNNKIDRSILKMPRVQAVIILVAVVLFFYVFWRNSLCESRDINDRYHLMLWDCIELSGIFYPVVDEEARQVHFVITKIMGDSAVCLGNTVIEGNGKYWLNIVWNCSGIKQFLEFFFIIILFPACHKKKLWYIPMGLVILYLFNIVRMTSVYYALENGTEFAETVHAYFKWAYNGLIFLFWLIWTEFIYVPARQKK